MVLVDKKLLVSGIVMVAFGLAIITYLDATIPTGRSGRTAAKPRHADFVRNYSRSWVFAYFDKLWRKKKEKRRRRKDDRKKACHVRQDFNTNCSPNQAKFKIFVVC